MIFIRRDDALTGRKPFDNLVKVAGQRALPAKGVDAVPERRSDKFVEAANRPDTTTIMHRHSEALAQSRSLCNEQTVGREW